MTIIQTGNESVTEFVIDNGNTIWIISFIFNMLIDIETIILYFHKLSLGIDLAQVTYYLTAKH